MNRKIILSSLLLILSSTVVLFAQSGETVRTAEDVFALAPSIEDKALSEVTTNEILALAEELSVKKQEEIFISEVAGLSLAIPGIGQFVTGEVGAGFLHVGMYAATIGGTLVATYFVLPQNVQDSLSGSQGEIETALDNATFVELLPAAGVMLGGAAVNALLRLWSSSHASDAAKRNIAVGSVTFSPDLRYLGTGAYFGMEMSF